MKLKRSQRSNDVETAEDARRKERSAARKWGKMVVKRGFTIIPTLLLKAQHRLGLSMAQLALIVHLADFWWEEGRKPFPSKQALMDRTGMSKRQIQRLISELDKAGLITRVVRTGANKGTLSNGYDFSGLVSKLKALEPDFRKADDDADESRRMVLVPRGKRRMVRRDDANG